MTFKRVEGNHAAACGPRARSSVPAAAALQGRWFEVSTVRGRPPAPGAVLPASTGGPGAPSDAPAAPRLGPQPIPVPRMGAPLASRAFKIGVRGQSRC